VLAAPNRLRASADFADVISHGARVGRPTLVVHARRCEETATKVGFVVSRAVGGAVIRNRVKRRLRALARPLVSGEAQQCYHVVVRALPGSVAQPGRLAEDLVDAWALATAKAGLS